MLKSGKSLSGLSGSECCGIGKHVLEFTTQWVIPAEIFLSLALVAIDLKIQLSKNASDDLSLSRKHCSINGSLFNGLQLCSAILLSPQK